MAKKTLEGYEKTQTETFQFDKAYEDQSKTEEIFEDYCTAIIDNAIQGGVGTIIAFGQTGSGKTYTITNLINNIAHYIFKSQKMFEAQYYNNQDSFTTKIKAIQIMGNDITDLNKKNKVMILENKHGKIEIANAEELDCTDGEQMAQKIHTSFASRRTEATAKNSVSSRSHAVIEIVFTNTAIKNAEQGKLYLIDLAGSERNKDSLLHDKERIKESKDIMSSLMNLKDCIRNRTLYLEDQSSSKH